MKTTVVMKSEKSRDLFGVIIRQETKNSMLSLTDLQEAYTRARIQNNWVVKDISHILSRDTNIERIFYLLQEQNIISDETTFSSFYSKVQDVGLIKVLKQLNVYKTTGRGENRQTLCNPYIWVLVAMELNPMLYAKVITWITDKLIINRIEACDLCNCLSSAMRKYIPSPNYSEINRQLNIKIFGHHQSGMRNMASEEELKKLSRLEENIAFCIKNGFIKNNEQAIEMIKKQ